MAADAAPMERAHLYKIARSLGILEFIADHSQNWSLGF
jgi:hypothetical protein